MLMSDCVVNAAVFLGLDDVVNAIENNQNEVPEETQKAIDLLVKCGNLVICEVAESYVPMKKIEPITSKNKIIDLGKLSRKVIDIYSLKLGAQRVKFKQLAEGLMVENDGEYNIEYSYSPSMAVLRGEIESPGNKLSERIAGYGMACEYCLISGMTDDAVLWDKRFKDALDSISDKHEKVIYRRKWE